MCIKKLWIIYIQLKTIFYFLCHYISEIIDTVRTSILQIIVSRQLLNIKIVYLKKRNSLSLSLLLFWISYSTEMNNNKKTKQKNENRYLS